MHMLLSPLVCPVLSTLHCVNKKQHTLLVTISSGEPRQVESEKKFWAETESCNTRRSAVEAVMNCRQIAAENSNWNPGHVERKPLYVGPLRVTPEDVVTSWAKHTKLHRHKSNMQINQTKQMKFFSSRYNTVHMEVLNGNGAVLKKTWI